MRSQPPAIVSRNSSFAFVWNYRQSVPTLSPGSLAAPKVALYHILYIALFTVRIFLILLQNKSVYIVYSLKKVLPLKIGHPQQPEARHRKYRKDLHVVSVWQSKCTCEPLQTYCTWTLLCFSRLHCDMSVLFLRTRSLLWSKRNTPELPWQHKIKDIINKVFVILGKTFFPVLLVFLVFTNMQYVLVYVNPAD